MLRLISSRRLRALERAEAVLARREGYAEGREDGRLDGALLALVSVTARILASEGRSREEREAALARIRASVRSSGGVQ